MATIDVSASTSTAQPWNAHEAVSILTFDYSAVTDPATTSDDVILGYLPANCVILGGTVRVVTAEGGTATIDIGTAASGTEIAAAVDINATAGTITNLALANPVMVPASPTGIWLDPNHNLDAAVVQIKLIVAYTNL